MKELVYHKSFLKQFAKLKPAERKRCQERISLYLENPDHPILNRHTLKGTYRGYVSINCGGDLRVILHESGSRTAIVTMGTHSQLYG